MAKVIWFVAGVVLGAVVADLFSRTPSGRIVTAGVNEFGRAVADAYAARKTELQGGS